MLALCGPLVLTPPLSGHARTLGALGLLSDILHVASAAVWVGGLAFLLLALHRAGAGRWPLAAHAVPRFSNLAVGSVAALLVAGTISAYLEVRTWSALWETRYGLLVLAKIALVLPLLALGAYNNRRAVPRLRKNVASTRERKRFLQTIGTELGIMVAVVAVTAVLIGTPPARVARSGRRRRPSARGTCSARCVRGRRPGRGPLRSGRRRPGDGRGQLDHDHAVPGRRRAPRSRKSASPLPCPARTSGRSTSPRSRTPPDRTPTSSRRRRSPSPGSGSSGSKSCWASSTL